MSTIKWSLLLVGVQCLLWTSCQPQNTSALSIATAANMQFAMKEIARSFTAETGIACETIISSSGKLTAQIMEGAPFDVLVSADMKYPRALFQQGFTTTEPKVYAYGKLVLWSIKPDVQPAIALLNQKTIKHIAIANPETAPYGAAAIEVLTQHGLYEQVKGKIVYGESIAQTNQFITSGAAEMGFTAKSVVLSPQIKGQGQWVSIPEETYTPIAQGVVLLNNRQEKQDAAKLFYEFLFSEKVKVILQEYGYGVTQH